MSEFAVTLNEFFSEVRTPLNSTELKGLEDLLSRFKAGERLDSPVLTDPVPIIKKAEFMFEDGIVDDGVTYWFREYRVQTANAKYYFYHANKHGDETYAVSAFIIVDELGEYINHFTRFIDDFMKGLLLTMYRYSQGLAFGFTISPQSLRMIYAQTKPTPGTQKHWANCLLHGLNQRISSFVGEGKEAEYYHLYAPIEYVLGMSSINGDVRDAAIRKQIRMKVGERDIEYLNAARLMLDSGIKDFLLCNSFIIPFNFAEPGKGKDSAPVKAPAPATEDKFKDDYTAESDGTVIPDVPTVFMIDLSACDNVEPNFVSKDNDEYEFTVIFVSGSREYELNLSAEIGEFEAYLDWVGWAKNLNKLLNIIRKSTGLVLKLRDLLSELSPDIKVKYEPKYSNEQIAFVEAVLGYNISLVTNSGFENYVNLLVEFPDLEKLSAEKRATYAAYLRSILELRK